MSRDLNQYSKAYAAQPFEPVMVKYRRIRTLEMLGDVSGCRILEIGCGSEPASAWIPVYQSLTILEPAEAFFQSALVQTQGFEKVHVIHSSAENIQHLPEAPFDVILLNSLLHELQHPDILLNALHPWCHAGTRILINVPNAWSFHRQLAVKMDLIPFPEFLSQANLTFQQATVFNTSSLKALCEGCHYEVQNALTSFIKPFTHAQMQEMLDKGLLSDNLLEGLYQMSSEMPDAGAEIFFLLTPAK